MQPGQESTHSILGADAPIGANCVHTAETAAGDMTGDPHLRLMTELINEVRKLRTEMRALTGAVMNREQAATYLGISVRNLHELVKQGLLKRVALSTGRYGFRREELDRYLASHENLYCDDGIETVDRLYAEAKSKD